MVFQLNKVLVEWPALDDKEVRTKGRNRLEKWMIVVEGMRQG